MLDIGPIWETAGWRNQDLWVWVNNRLNSSQHCALAAKKTKHIMGCVQHSIASWSNEVILLLYYVLVRPYLDYCVQLWAPQCKKDVEVRESVQRRATNLAKGPEGMSCADGGGHLGCLVWRKGGSAETLLIATTS